jgi:hypothetical protein
MKLEKCPFCRGDCRVYRWLDAEDGRRAIPKCQRCGASLPKCAGPFSTEKAAIEAAARLWNTRTSADPAKEEPRPEPSEEELMLASAILGSLPDPEVVEAARQAAVHGEGGTIDEIVNASDEITPEWLEAEGWNGNNNTWTRDGVRIEVNSLSHGCWSASVEGVHLCYLRSIHDLLRLVAAIRG